MMHKNIFVKIISVFILLVIVSCNLCFASEIDEINKEENSSTEELLVVINECVNEIKSELKEIDKTLNSLDKTEEYEKYPAIRLNIDTPFFGLSSMVDKKLKIKNKVSTVDVAQGYSIKDIVNNMSMKLPDFEVGNIVVSTRDVKFDNNISQDDAKECILKLVQYISQIQNTNELLNKRINSIFVGYIPDEKSKKIEEMNKRLQNLSLNIIAKDNDIITIKLLNTDENSKKLITKYYDINKQIYNLENLLDNVLLSNEELVNVEKELQNLELNTTYYLKEVNNEITKLTNDLDIQNLLNNTKNILEEKYNDLNQYVDKSTVEEQVKTAEDSEIVTDEINESYVDKLKVIRYEVSSMYIIDYEKTLLNSLDEKIRYYIPENIDENPQIIQEVSADEKNSLLEDVIKLYKEFIQKENKFYLDNLNFILRDTTYKLAKLPEYTDSTTVQDVAYIYIILPEEIDTLLAEYNTKSSVQLEALTSNLKDRIAKIVKSNIKVNKEYNNFKLS